jgi:hypothetical protein
MDLGEVSASVLKKVRARIGTFINKRRVQSRHAHKRGCVGRSRRLALCGDLHHGDEEQSKSSSDSHVFHVSLLPERRIHWALSRALAAEMKLNSRTLRASIRRAR